MTFQQDIFNNFHKNWPFTHTHTQTILHERAHTLILYSNLKIYWMSTLTLIDNENPDFLCSHHYLHDVSSLKGTNQMSLPALETNFISKKK